METARLPPNALAGGAAVTAQAASRRWQDALSTLARLAAQQVALNPKPYPNPNPNPNPNPKP